MNLKPSRKLCVIAIYNSYCYSPYLFLPYIYSLISRWLTPLQELVSSINEKYGEFFRMMGCAGEVALSSEQVWFICFSNHPETYTLTLDNLFMYQRMIILRKKFLNCENRDVQEKEHLNLHNKNRSGIKSLHERTTHSHLQPSTILEHGNEIRFYPLLSTESLIGTLLMRALS